MSHGGAFRKFNGLKTHKANYVIGEQNSPGIPCLYTKHNRNSSARCWRDTSTHACLECLDDIKEHKFGLDLNRFNSEVRKRALKFWSKVEITEFDDCWQWNDDPTKKQLYFFWDRREIRNRFQWHPIVVSMWLCWGDTGRLGSESICGNRRCVNPLHNLPKGLIPSIRIEDYNEQWLSLELKTLKQQVSDYLINTKSAHEQSSTIQLPGIDDDENECSDTALKRLNYLRAFTEVQSKLASDEYLY